VILKQVVSLLLIGLFFISCTSTYAVNNQATNTIAISNIEKTRSFSIMEIETHQPLTPTYGGTKISSPKLAESTPIPQKPSETFQITNDQTNVQDGKNGTIYFWNSKTENSSEYFNFNPDIENQIYINMIRPTQKAVLGPSRSTALSFSPYSKRIAYLTNTDKLELWLADVNVQNVKMVWQDDGHWLGDISSNFDVQILWGPNDRYIILSSRLVKSHLLIYDQVSGISEELAGECGLISKSTLDKGLAIWCSNNDLAGKTYYVLEKSGIVPVNHSPVPLIAKAIDWVFSRDGHRILFATQNKKIEIVDENGKLLNLPLSYLADYMEGIIWRKSLQWSQDGKLVLVYGLETNTSLCPEEKGGAVEVEFSKRPCWFVLDAYKGKPIWWLNKKIADQIDVPIEYLRSEYDATLSPDGNWIATTFTDYRIGHWFYFVSVPIQGGNVRVVALEQGQLISWVK
jgi:hypothetical protein